MWYIFIFFVEFNKVFYVEEFVDFIWFDELFNGL